MAARFVKYKISSTIESVPYVYFFLAPPDHYENINTDARVELVDPDTIENDMPVTKVEELLKSPVATRKKSRLSKATEDLNITILLFLALKL